MPTSRTEHGAGRSSLRLEDALIRVRAREWGPVVQDHREAVGKSVFVAIQGRHVDARAFAAEAVRRGAVAVVAHGDPPFDFPLDAAFWIRVGDDRRALSRLAAAAAGHPSRYLGVTAVTGTNGKTTVTYLLDAIWQAAGRRTGRIGTVEIKIGPERLPARMTTPDAPDLHGLLRRMREAGVEEVAMEASSHALSQRRVDDVDVDVAVLTNVRRDHLDYHRTLRAYRDAKGRLFTRLLVPGVGYDGRERTAVLPLDEESGDLFARRTRARVWRYGVRSSGAGMGPAADPVQVAAEDVDLRGFGARFRLCTPHGSRRVEIDLPGAFNVRNALAAACAALATGVSLDAVEAGLAQARPAPGRMETVWRGDAVVMVDFAHNPDGIDEMARAARALVTPPGRLVLLLGAEGGKDRGKRPLMGAAAARWADLVWVTSDSPHDEDPDCIVRQVAEGTRGASAEVRTVTDRRAAIRAAVLDLRPGDLLVVAGRGPETVQIVGRQRLPWSDADAVWAALAERFARAVEEGAPNLPRLRTAPAFDPSGA